MEIKRIVASLIFALSFLLIPVVNSNAQQLDSLSYDVYIGDRDAGFLHVWQDGEGNIRSIFEFNDRGRGPHLEESVRLNAEGLIVRQSVEGHNYLKEPVDEVFEVRGDSAYWQSDLENGSASFNGECFYMSAQGDLNTELLIRKLLDESEPEIELLPGGRAEVQQMSDYTIGDGLQLKLVTLTGLDFGPQHYWMDADRRMFGRLSFWWSVVREDSRSLVGTLRKLQDEEINAYYRGLAEKYIHQLETPIAITDVTLFDSKSAAIKPGQTVIIEGNRIVQTGDTASLTIPESAKIIDGSGKTLLPGLFDMHTHGSKKGGLLHLAAGVTSVRDMGNVLDFPEVKRKFNSNTLIGPRVAVMSGFIDQAGPYAGPTGKIVESLEEGLEAVEYYHEHGYQQIKLYSSIDPEWVEPLAVRAHELGMRVSGHIPASMLAAGAVEGGYDEIQHVNMLVLNFLPDTLDTRTPVRFTEVAQNAHKLDLEGSEFKGFMKRLKDNDVVVDPTVTVFEGMFAARPGKPDPSFEMVLDRLPVQVRRNFYSGGLPVPEGMGETYQDSYRKLLDIIHALHGNGVTIVPGTDALPGFGLHRELENYVRAGIPADEVLRMATYTSAQVAGVADRLGSIEEGKLADLILVDGTPTEDISDIRKVVLTIKDGNLYYPEELYPAVGVRYEH